METKTFRAEIKSTNPNGYGEFDAILSTPQLDRDGEIVVAKALEPLPGHITIDIDHGLSVATTIGSGEPYYDGDILKVKGRFASTQLGQDVRALVDEKHIRHMSVVMAFTQKETRDDGITYITKGELINATMTGIPANTGAEILSSKSFIEALTEKIGSRNSKQDVQRIQGAHDLFVELGAACGTKCAHNVEQKSADTDTPPAAAVEAPAAGHEVEVAKAKARMLLASASLALS